MASPAQLAARAKFAAMIHSKHGGKSPAKPMDKTEPQFPDSKFPPKQPAQANPHGTVVMMNPFAQGPVTPPSHNSTPHAGNPKIKKH